MFLFFGTRLGKEEIQKIYDDLEEQFRRHHLLVGGPEEKKEVKFSKISKKHIGMFLKELGYTKHYENRR